MQLQILRGKAI